MKPGSADIKNPVAYRDLWDRKAVLRAVYSDIYRRMVSATVPGHILELGGGSGNFKLFAPDAVGRDILSAPWLDLVCDAQRLPFSDQAFSNVVMMDVLHHVENPLRALRQACGVLRVGGRVIMCEPAITPLSGIFYRLFHEEPVDMSSDPLRDGSISDRSISLRFQPGNSDVAGQPLSDGIGRRLARAFAYPGGLVFVLCVPAVGRLSALVAASGVLGGSAVGAGVAPAAHPRTADGIPAACCLRARSLGAPCAREDQSGPPTNLRCGEPF